MHHQNFQRVSSQPHSTGRELEFGLLGVSPLRKQEKRFNPNQSLADVLIEIKNETDLLQAKEEARGKERTTTYPKKVFLKALQAEIYRILGLDPSSKLIGVYNCVETIADTHYGTDFFISLSPKALSQELFGKEVANFTYPVMLAGDITLQETKYKREDVIVLSFAKVPQTEAELKELGENAAKIMLRGAVNTIGKLNKNLGYAPPILKLLEKEKREVEKVRSGVVKRTAKTIEERA